MILLQVRIWSCPRRRYGTNLALASWKDDRTLCPVPRLAAAGLIFLGYVSTSPSASHWMNRLSLDLVHRTVISCSLTWTLPAVFILYLNPNTSKQYCFVFHTDYFRCRFHHPYKLYSYICNIFKTAHNRRHVWNLRSRYVILLLQTMCIKLIHKIYSLPYSLFEQASRNYVILGLTLSKLSGTQVHLFHYENIEDFIWLYVALKINWKYSG